MASLSSQLDPPLYSFPFIPPVRSRPTEDEVHAAEKVATRIMESKSIKMASVVTRVVPDEQLLRFEGIWEELSKLVAEITPDLALYVCFWRGEPLNMIMQMLAAAIRQQDLCKKSPPLAVSHLVGLQYIVKIMRGFARCFKAMMRSIDECERANASRVVPLAGPLPHWPTSTPSSGNSADTSGLEYKQS